MKRAMKKIGAIALAAILALGAFTVAPTSALAAGGDFAIFGGSGGAGGVAYANSPSAGGAQSQLSAINGAGGNSSSLGGGGGGEAGLIDGNTSSGGANGSDFDGSSTGAGGGTNTDGKGGSFNYPAGNGNNGGGGGGKISNNPQGGTGSTKSETLSQPDYDSVAIEGGHGGGGGNAISATTGHGGAGGAVATAYAGNLRVSGGVTILGGMGGAGGDLWKRDAVHNPGNGLAGNGGSGGSASFTITGDLSVGGALSITSGTKGTNGEFKNFPDEANTTTGTNGTGGAGGDAAFSVSGTLTSPAINLAKKDGDFSFTAGTLNVTENTTLTADGTAAADVNFTTVNVADGTTLAIDNSNGALTIGTLNIYGTGNVVINSNANITINDVTVEVGVKLSAPTGATVDKGTQNLVLAFNKTVTAVQNGIITLSDDSCSYTYTIPANPAIISGTNASCVATIPIADFIPALTLEDGKTYTVSVSADAFEYAYTLGVLSGTQKNAVNASVGSFTVAAQGQTTADPDPIYTTRTLTDKPTGVTVTGQMTNYARLIVRECVLHAEGSCPACDEIRARIAAGEVIILYDISISGGYIGALEVSIPVGEQYNGQMVTILHCKNGVMESVTCVVRNGVAKGTFKKLSPFAVVRGVNVGVPENTVVDPPQTGDAPTGGMAGVWLVLLALGLAVMVQKKRRSTNS